MRLILFFFFAATTCVQASGTVAFFGIHMLDTSLQTMEQGQDPGQAARLAAITDLVADRFTTEGYELLDLAPIQAQLDDVVNPAKCYGCDTRMAQQLDADFVLVGEVQKVSDLILTLNLQLRDAQTGALVKAGVVDIRGDTDENWMRGMRYILKNRIFRKDN